ncbi:triose-phosphate isomerase [Nitrospina gracilis]|uniref:triose-phosphate isomerase n=1 Tax=Nitrospina gracilis TaxID=35801 RepID=UPI002351B18E|nr:triose-phosphate isomerase [Nitrospina gracilis]
MRKTLIAGNWKMNKTLSQTEGLLRNLTRRLDSDCPAEVVVAPPFTSLALAASLLKGTDIGLAAQNVFAEDAGAYTGEISAPMLVEAGCGWVIVGHSERRRQFGESEALINRKVKHALDHNLKVILCVGETDAERNAGQTESVVHLQLTEGLKDVTSSEAGNVVIAYEPVWAIGTGKNATPQQAEQVHCLIRKWMGELYGPSVAETTRVLYGGSVTPENSRGMLAEDNIDGALVGGASLDADLFCAIIGSAE